MNVSKPSRIYLKSLQVLQKYYDKFGATTTNGRLRTDPTHPTTVFVHARSVTCHTVTVESATDQADGTMCHTTTHVKSTHGNRKAREESREDG
jgi:hypothetical protein